MWWYLLRILKISVVKIEGQVQVKYNRKHDIARTSAQYFKFYYTVCTLFYFMYTFLAKNYKYGDK